ncbi:restriction endonuclease subunit S [Campylobacter jejuni]|uniref:restriction endonuclease subunit S n=1 Tax=Campylobacter TaxID=194 RepID=UPI0002DB8F62|nr:MULTISPECIES: restriction endonuclease subunit S [Campylobacter]AHY40725.1 Type I restriction-modification system, specificity subunit S [Campylobacter jejuni subsp. jejuni CG8421]AUG27900.1 type I restriction endonuclease [Campylobacter coli]EAB5290218.1 restriction endonuclease subunit S [Campylobacter jejuni]EAC1969722.1 restriction endonuclease subunit S [Campylobacter coli]EAC1970125.1 restriction endonuclease subunit S [Campylobacter coli]
MQNKMTNLPQGWEVKKLEEIANIKGGKRLPKGKNLLDNNTKFAYIRVADFQDNGTINLQNIKFINENTYNVLKNYKIYDDNLYISIAGTIGKSGIIPKELNGAILTENAVKLEYIQNNISNKFMYFFTLSNIFKTQIQTSTKIVAQPKLAITRLKQIQIPLPPLKEQERIVGILDESFAKIDESIKILEQDLLNLDELMQSALQKAFNPLKDNAKENYKLPQSWEWKSLEEISENISAGGDKPKNCTESKTAKNQIPVYANGVNNNGLVGYTDKATIIKPSLTISARGTIGFVCIRKEPYFPIVRLISLIPCENILCLHYLYFCLNFFIAKGEGSSIPQLTIPKFKSLQIPLPPLKEQEQIAEHLDFVFEKAKALKELYTKELKDYEELKQSLLNKAFKGEL